MAGRISGITIKIGGDTTKLQESLRGVDKELRNTQSALKDVNKLLKLDPGSTELLTQKQKDLEKAIGTTKTRLDELKKAQAGVSEGTDEWDALQREIIATEQDLQGLEQEYRNFGSVGAQQVAAVGAKMQDVGSAIEGAGQKLAPVSAAAAGLIGSLVGLGYSALTSADDLNTLAKQTGLSTDEIQKMQYAADLVDVSFSDIEGALKKMKSKMDPTNETFQKLGVAVTDTDGNMRSATDVFYDSIAALSQIENETERDQLAMELFGKSADSLAGIIDDGGAALKEYGQQAEDLGLILSQETLDDLNAMNDVVDTLKANFKGAFAKVGATLAKTFAPALQKAADFAQRLADKIANLSPKTLKLVTGIAAVVAAIAPVLIVGGKLVSGVGKVLTFAPKIVSAIKLVTTALMSPVGVMGIVMAGAIALVVAVVKNWDKIKAVTQALGDKIVGIWETVKSGVSNAVSGLKEWISTTWLNIRDAVVNSEFVQGAIQAWTNLKNGVVNAVRGIRIFAITSWNNIKSNVEEAASTISSAVSEKFEAAKSFVTTAVQGTRATVVQTWSKIRLGVQSAANAVKTGVTNAWNTAKDNVTNAIQALQDGIRNKWNAIRSSTVSIVSGIVSTIGSKFRSAWTTVTSIFNSIQTSISDKITAAKDAVSTAVEAIKNFFNFTFTWPHIPLPHFTITPEGWKVSDLFRGIKPVLGIDWYAKAYDNPMMFTKPTVMQTPYGLKGFGDGHGAEIVLGLNKLRELVGTSGNQVTINVYPPPGANVEQIAAAVEQKLVAAQQRRIRVYA